MDVIEVIKPARTNALKVAQAKYVNKIKHNEEYRIKRRLYSKKYYEKIKNNEEFKEKNRLYSKQYYDNKKKIVV
tara:strand:+ start:475 stop:696 length:222 start_codon:yes stop_codon:yes gene_type:complete